jgi:hypothetical protein
MYLRLMGRNVAPLSRAALHLRGARGKAVWPMGGWRAQGWPDASKGGWRVEGRLARRRVAGAIAPADPHASISHGYPLILADQTGYGGLQ